MTILTVLKISKLIQTQHSMVQVSAFYYILDLYYFCKSLSKKHDTGTVITLSKPDLLVCYNFSFVKFRNFKHSIFHLINKTTQIHLQLQERPKDQSVLPVWIQLSFMKLVTVQMMSMQPQFFN